MIGIENECIILDDKLSSEIAHKLLSYIIDFREEREKKIEVFEEIKCNKRIFVELRLIDLERFIINNVSIKNNQSFYEPR